MKPEELKNRIGQFRRYCRELSMVTHECLKNPSETALDVQKEMASQRNACAVAICDELAHAFYREEKANEMANQQPTKTEGAE